MERRIFVAILLAALVMYGWQVAFPPPAPPERVATPQTPGTPPATPSGTPPATTAVPGGPGVPPTSAAPAAASTPAPDAIISEPTEREIVVETSSVQAVLT